MRDCVHNVGIFLVVQECCPVMLLVVLGHSNARVPARTTNIRLARNIVKTIANLAYEGNLKLAAHQLIKLTKL